MLFHSEIFVFYFLPITTLLLFTSASIEDRLFIFTLIVASLVFYGWWDWELLPMLTGSICANWLAGKVLARSDTASNSAEENRSQPSKRWFLAACIAANLGLLGYYKYRNFGLDIFADLTGADWSAEKLVIPLGISFWTFQQIAYLVDVFRSQKNEESFINYFAFITFFPQLIAGPICYHGELIPQLRKSKIGPEIIRNVQVGLVIFLVGIFKKIVIADYFATISDPVFAGEMTDPASTARGVLGFSLQIYYDFSAYSEMAMGLAYMFGIKLPINFYSPYKSVDIVEFWRCWHITLSRFLRDYLYIPLGGNRAGRLREYANLFIVMLLGGLWHGANWTFVAWGFGHGALLATTHAARRITPSGWTKNPRTWPGYGVRRLLRLASQILTFILVTLLWVLFRSDDFGTAWKIYGQLGQLEASAVATSVASSDLYFILVAVCVFFLPNVVQIFSRFSISLTSPPQDLSFDRRAMPATFRMGSLLPHRTQIFLAALTALCIAGIVATVWEGAPQQEFIYFEF